MVIEDEFNSYSEPQIGEIIVFPMKPDKHCKNPFGVGKVLKNTGDELEIQWFGSIAGRIDGTYRPAWMRASNKHYYAAKKEHTAHTPVTNFTEMNPFYVAVQPQYILCKGYHIM